VRVPRFALWAAWNSRRQRAGEGPLPGAASFDAAPWDALPIALVRDGRVVEATPAARRAGAAASPARRDARGTGIELLDWDAAAVDAEVTRGTARFLAASAQVTPVAGAPGMWWAGVGSAEQSGGGERGAARALARVARLWHPRARVAVASSCVAARAGVWGDAPARGPAGGSAAYDGLPETVRVVPRGGCAAFIADAPVGFVPMDEVLRRALVTAGVRTVGALAALDPATVLRRWGPAGAAAWRLACGDDARRPVLGGDAARRAVVAELATPATTLPPVLALVRAGLERLATQVAADGRMAAVVALTLTLDDGRGAHPAGGLARTVTRELRLPCPLGAAPIYSRCRALLDRWSPPAPVCGVRVEFTATAPAPRPAAMGGLV
jgi:protein ImuB